MPNLTVHPAILADITNLRHQFLKENPIQIRYEGYHLHGWADYYQLTVDGQAAGYGAVKGLDDLKARDTVFEYFLLPQYRPHARPLFEQLLAASGAPYLESQTNLPLLTELVRAYAQRITAPVLLFAAGEITAWPAPAGVHFRARREADTAFAKTDTGRYVLERDGELVASGDFLTHYNPPFADIYMEVAAPYRRRGYGRYLVQELQRVCRAAGYTPAARCRRENVASRATLLSAGFWETGRMLVGYL